MVDSGQVIVRWMKGDLGYWYERWGEIEERSVWIYPLFHERHLASR